MCLVLTTFESGFVRKALPQDRTWEVGQLTRFPNLDVAKFQAHELIFLLAEDSELAALNVSDRSYLIDQINESKLKQRIVIIVLPSAREHSLQFKPLALDWLSGLESTGCNVLDAVDLERILDRESIYDSLLYFHTGCRYSTAFLNLLASWLVNLKTFKDGTQKKLLIVDLDNTLWPGVLSEDGAEEIESHFDSAEGRAYLEFQKEILRARELGYMIALCSKNDRAHVEEFLNSSQHIEFTIDDFSFSAIEWKSKDEMVSNILAQLRIHPESTYFIDDNRHERDLIQRRFPQIEIPHLPENEFERALFLRKLIGIFNPFASLSDKNRNLNYIENTERESARLDFSSPRSWIESLEAQVTFSKISDANFERLFQLSNKTNQFNLNPRRQTLSEFKILYSSAEIFAGAVSYRDRLGDDGIIGLIALENKGDSVTVREFILSCRSFGRGIEDAMFDFILKYVDRGNFKELNWSVDLTPRNLMAADFMNRKKLKRINLKLFATDLGNENSDSCFEIREIP